MEIRVFCWFCIIGMAGTALADIELMDRSAKVITVMETQLLPLGYSLGHIMNFISQQTLNYKIQEYDFNLLKETCSLAFLTLQEEKIDFNALKEICGRKVRFLAKLRMHDQKHQVYTFENNKDRDRLTNFVKRDTGVIRVEWCLFYKSWIRLFLGR